MHARKTARDAYFPARLDDAFFASRGDVVLRDSGAARRFAERVNSRDGRTGSAALRPAEIAAMALVHELFHEVIAVYRRRHASRFEVLLTTLDTALADVGSNIQSISTSICTISVIIAANQLEAAVAAVERVFELP